MITLKREKRWWHIGFNGNKYIVGNQVSAFEKIKRLKADEPTADYPYGNSIEPYDIWRENNLLTK